MDKLAITEKPASDDAITEYVTNRRLVYKVGATTGITKGILTKTNVDRNGFRGLILIEDYTGSEDYFESAKFCSQGDSGSLVFITNHDKLIPIAILQGTTSGQHYCWPLNKITWHESETLKCPKSWFNQNDDPTENDLTEEAYEEDEQDIEDSNFEREDREIDLASESIANEENAKLGHTN